LLPSPELLFEVFDLVSELEEIDHPDTDDRKKAGQKKKQY
jgi:hypothetical protein